MKTSIKQSWWYRNGDGVVAASVLAGAVVVVVGIYMIFGSVHCWWNWHDSGMDARYRPFAGCQVERHGHWLPANTIRETP